MLKGSELKTRVLKLLFPKWLSKLLYKSEKEYFVTNYEIKNTCNRFTEKLIVHHSFFCLLIGLKMSNITNKCRLNKMFSI